MGGDAAKSGERDAAVPRALVAGAALAMVVLGRLLLHYGLELVDEGTLLAQFDRVRLGQWPYRDFHTGHGPAAFLLNGTLLAVFGPHLDVVRGGLVVTHALGLAALGALAARALGGRGAMVVVALTVSFFLPIAPGAFCVWNIPYPSWYAQTLGTLALLSALAVPRRGALALVTCGVLWGAAFCFKQNTGLLGLAAVLVWRTIERDAGAPRGRRVLGVAVAGALAFGALGIVTAGGLGPAGTVALGAPALTLAARVARTRPEAALIGDAAWLGGGFAAVTLPMLGIAVWGAGWPAVAQQVLHLGSNAAGVYGVAYPGFAAVAGAVAGMSTGLRGVRRAMDLGWLLVLPIAHFVAALGLRPGTCTPAWRLVVPTAVLAYLQLYPRADFWHLLAIAGVSLTVAVGVGVQAIAQLAGGRTRPVSVVFGGLLVLAALRWLPNLAVVTAALQPAPSGTPTLARATLRWDLAAAPALRDVPAVVEALAGAPQVVGFPALAVFNFLSGVPSPLRHDYFFPGLLSAAEQQSVAETLASARAARIVVLREPMAFFAAAFDAYAPLDEAIGRSFPALERIGPYEVRGAAP